MAMHLTATLPAAAGPYFLADFTVACHRLLAPVVDWGAFTVRTERALERKQWVRPEQGSTDVSN